MVLQHEDQRSESWGGGFLGSGVGWVFQFLWNNVDKYMAILRYYKRSYN